MESDGAEYMNYTELCADHTHEGEILRGTLFHFLSPSRVISPNGNNRELR